MISALKGPVTLADSLLRYSPTTPSYVPFLSRSTNSSLDPSLYSYGGSQRHMTGIWSE